MDEQEILLKLKAHVSRHRHFASDDPHPAPSRAGARSIDPSIISGLSAEVWASREAVGQLNLRNPGIVNQLAQAFKKALQRSLSWYTRSLQAFHLSVARAIEEHGTAIASVEQSTARLEDEVREIQSRIPALTRYNRVSESEVVQESLWVAERAVQEQQAPYLELFQGRSPVVDVGCGRGEFLELLHQHGIGAYGVDSDPTACDVVRRKQLNVVEADFFEHLQQLPDRSLGGIFSARVIEYLPPHRQVEFIALLSRKTKRDGLVVIETMNPESAIGFGRNDRLDPSHLHAIHPELLKSLLESNSFGDVKLCSMAPVEGRLKAATPSGASFDASPCHRTAGPGGPRRLLTQAYVAMGRQR
jgi:2-polyprenyl-3-methyl-5-hydroxy-6-metoxy-1,4-benzoquinol methylase